MVFGTPLISEPTQRHRFFPFNMLILRPQKCSEKTVYSHFLATTLPFLALKRGQEKLPFKTFKDPASMGKLAAAIACNHILPLYPREHDRTLKNYDQNVPYFDNSCLKNPFWEPLAQTKAAVHLRTYKSEKQASRYHYFDCPNS